MIAQANNAKTIFLNALEIAATAERQAFVAGACGDDEGLRREVEDLLQHHEGVESFLEAPGPGLARTAREIPVTERPGNVIGPYKLTEQIGEGGMGLVFVAEQQQPVRRKVALKVIRPGMDSAQVIARFEAERQALALMDHPNIARVLDAGATPAGRPYFVMELVHGIPITDYCDQARLGVPARLRLFIDVCRAVQHAHTKGIIHRDLKPTNVLVTSHDGVPVAKVIDFGVAKALGPALTERTLHTGFAQMIGTPLYMSPEQAEFNQLGVDTRSDVYALGVLLYELLTGVTPFDAETLKTAALDELRRIIREDEPPRPSHRLSSLAAEAQSTVSQRRGVDGRRLGQTLRGELDWIVMRALEKDRTRRYESASAFAADVQRYLNDEAVQACPPSAWYRFRKFARRNKVVLTTVALVAAAVVLGTVVSIWQAVRATGAEVRAIADRDSAAKARTRAEIVNQFLADLIKEMAPDENPRNRLDPESVLRKAVRKIEGDPTFVEQPEVEASIRLTIGQTFFKVGLVKDAEFNLRRAVGLSRESLGPEDPVTLTAQEALAWLLTGGLRRHAEAEPLSRDTWQARRRVFGPEHPDTLESMMTYGVTLGNLEKFTEAEPLLRECWESDRRVLGVEHYWTLTCQNNLGSCLVTQGKGAEAEVLLRPCYETHRRIRGMEHEETMSSLNNLCVALLLVGKSEEAERLLREGLDVMRGSHGPEHPGTIHLQHQLARALVEQRKYEEAEAHERGALTLRRKVLPAGNESIGRSLLVLGRILAETNRGAEAESHLREALDVFRKNRSAKKALVAEVESWLGACLAAQGRHDEAEPLLLAGYEVLKDLPGTSPRQREVTLDHLVKLYESWGKKDKAAEWRAKRDPEGPSLE